MQKLEVGKELKMFAMDSENNHIMTHCKVYIKRMAIAEAFLWTRSH